METLVVGQSLEKLKTWAKVDEYWTVLFWQKHRDTLLELNQSYILRIYSEYSSIDGSPMYSCQWNTTNYGSPHSTVNVKWWIHMSISVTDPEMILFVTVYAGEWYDFDQEDSRCPGPRERIPFKCIAENATKSRGLMVGCSHGSCILIQIEHDSFGWSSKTRMTTTESAHLTICFTQRSHLSFTRCERISGNLNLHWKSYHNPWIQALDAFI